jgi:hypothetical protein
MSLLQINTLLLSLFLFASCSDKFKPVTKEDLNESSTKIQTSNLCFNENLILKFGQFSEGRIVNKDVKVKSLNSDSNKLLDSKVKNYKFDEYYSYEDGINSLMPTLGDNNDNPYRNVKFIVAMCANATSASLQNTYFSEGGFGGKVNVLYETWSCYGPCN